MAVILEVYVGVLHSALMSDTRNIVWFSFLERVVVDKCGMHTLSKGRCLGDQPTTTAEKYPPYEIWQLYFCALLCKKMSFCHWLGLVQLGTHQHRERSLFWFSLDYLSFPSQNMCCPESKLIMDIWITNLVHFERNNNFPLWRTHFSFLLYGSDCASFPCEMLLKHVMKLKIYYVYCISVLPCEVRNVVVYIKVV